MLHRILSHRQNTTVTSCPAKPVFSVLGNDVRKTSTAGRHNTGVAEQHFCIDTTEYVGLFQVFSHILRRKKSFFSITYFRLCWLRSASVIERRSEENLRRSLMDSGIQTLPCPPVHHANKLLLMGWSVFSEVSYILLNTKHVGCQQFCRIFQ
jgi:hypothetical protein